jgi:tetratricopeptide (TPR) repeat protein
MEKFLDIHDTEGPAAEVFSGLGIIAFYQKRFKDSFSLLYESIKLNPTDTDAFLNFLDAARECDQVEDAKKIFSVYCKEFPLLQKIAYEFEEASS